jgi:hypothetical protein
MKISLTKKQKRNRVVCTRDDGSYSISDLGPKLPHHDLAHFVAESTLQLRRGFFGNLASGYSFEQLGDKEVIKTLPAETLFAEVLAGALGSLATGACTLEQFPEFVAGALARFDYKPAVPTKPQIEKMAADFSALLSRWSELGEGETLELTFSI